MITTDTILINPHEHDALCYSYAHADELLGKMETNLLNIRRACATGYLGAASSVLSESLEIYIKHIKALQLCCMANNEYIDNAFDKITQTDNQLMNEIST